MFGWVTDRFHILCKQHVIVALFNCCRRYESSPRLCQNIFVIPWWWDADHMWLKHQDCHLRSVCDGTDRCICWDYCGITARSLQERLIPNVSTSTRWQCSYLWYFYIYLHLCIVGGSGDLVAIFFLGHCCQPCHSTYLSQIKLTLEDCFCLAHFSSLFLFSWTKDNGTIQCFFWCDSFLIISVTLKQKWSYLDTWVKIIK